MENSPGQTEGQIQFYLQNPQTHNSYSYTANNPLKYVDKNGEFLIQAVAAGLLMPNVAGAPDVGEERTIGQNTERTIFAASMMTPSPNKFIGPTKSIVGQSFGKLGTVVENTSNKITGFTEHGLNQVINRGVTPDLLLDATKNAAVTLQQKGGNVLHLTENAGVVLNRAGEIVTAYTSKDFKTHVTNVLNKVIKKETKDE